MERHTTEICNEWVLVMAYYTAVTGKLGQGKGLFSINKMMDYLREGKPVITNMDIFPENFPRKFRWNQNIRIYRVPDEPTSDDILSCGRGNDTMDPEENGICMLDELVTWFNSKDWNSPNAKKLNKLLVHLRKLGWDGVFQVQSIESMNSEAVRNIITSHAVCNKLTKLHVPVLTFIIRQFIDKAPKLPKFFRFHTVKVHNLVGGHLEEKHRYKGTDMYAYYDTNQIFDGAYPHGTFCYLTPWHLVGRYQPKKTITFKQIVNFVLIPVVILFQLLASVLNQDLIKLGVLKSNLS